MDSESRVDRYIYLGEKPVTRMHRLIPANSRRCDSSSLRSISQPDKPELHPHPIDTSRFPIRLCLFPQSTGHHALHLSYPVVGPPNPADANVAFHPTPHLLYIPAHT